MCVCVCVCARCACVCCCFSWTSHCVRESKFSQDYNLVPPLLYSLCCLCCCSWNSRILPCAQFRHWVWGKTCLEFQLKKPSQKQTCQVSRILQETQTFGYDFTLTCIEEMVWHMLHCMAYTWALAQPNQLCCAASDNFGYAHIFPLPMQALDISYWYRYGTQH